MQTDRPFKVINCLSQGHAVAGPPVDSAPGVDLEMVLWGASLDKAIEMAKELNSSAGAATEPKHLRD